MFIQCQTAEVWTAGLPIMGVKTRWNSTLQLLEWAYQLREFPNECLKNPKYGYCRTPYTTQDEWTIVEYFMEVLRPFQYWTLWMSKRHMVSQHHVITICDDMFHHREGVVWALAMKKTQWKEFFFSAMKFVPQKLSNDYTKLTPMMAMRFISAYILNCFRKLPLFKKWGKAMDTNTENETSLTTKYQKLFLKYVKNEYCAKHRRLHVIKPETILINNLSSSPMASRSGQSSYDL